MIPVTVFSKQIMTIFGNEFCNGYVTLLLLCFFAVLYIIGNTVDQIILSQGKAWISFAYCILGSFVSFCVCYFLVTKDYGSIGLVLAMIAGHLTRSMFWIVYFSVQSINKTRVNI